MVADIPGYNVFKKIGAGGFGTAYLVQRKSDGQRYVGKQIYVSDINSNDFHHALLEVRMLRSLSSRRIVKYVDFLVHGNNCNIIMEYCDGGDLQKVVDDHKRSQVIIPERQISLWMSQVAEALDFCHNQCPPIIHRDVKLQNIFVMADMKKCKLGDFGIAKSLSGRNDFAKTIIGTPVNFCPELCEGRQYSSKADVWAYGCVLYELKFLRHPMMPQNGSPQLGQLLFNIRNLCYEKKSCDFGNLVQKCLSYRPSDRPSMKQIQMCSIFNIESSSKVGIRSRTSTYQQPIESFIYQKPIKQEILRHDIKKN